MNSKLNSAVDPVLALTPATAPAPARAAAQKSSLTLPAPPAQQTHLPSPKLKHQTSAQEWHDYSQRRSASIRQCLTLLMNVSMSHARAKEIWKYPTASPRALQYNQLLKATYYEMAAKNPLLTPMGGKWTRNRDAFQGLLLPLHHFVILANSEVSPYTSIISPSPAFQSFSPKRPIGGPSSEELLLQLMVSDLTPGPDESDDEGDDDDAASPSTVHADISTEPKGERNRLAYFGALLNALEAGALSKNPAKWLHGTKLNVSSVEDQIRAFMEQKGLPHRFPSARKARDYLTRAREAFVYKDFGTPATK